VTAGFAKNYANIIYTVKGQLRP